MKFLVPVIPAGYIETGMIADAAVSEGNCLPR